MNLLLSQAWETYESDKRIEGFSPQTLKAYKLQSALLIRFLKDVQLDTITTDQLKAYLAKSSENLKPASLAHRIRFMKSLFRWSHEEGYIPINPAAKINEELLGKTLAGRREKAVVATKFGFGPNWEFVGGHPDYVKKAIDECLKRLG